MPNANFTTIILEGADAATFEICGSGIALDKNHIYQFDKIADINYPHMFKNGKPSCS